MTQQAYRYVILRLWFVALFNVFRAENHKHWNQVGGDWKRVSCHGNKMFYSRRWDFCRTISLKIGQDSPIYILDVIMGGVYDIIRHIICIFYTFFKLTYLRNKCRYLQTVNGVFILSWNSTWYSQKTKGWKFDHSTTLKEGIKKNSETYLQSLFRTWLSFWLIFQVLSFSWMEQAERKVWRHNHL